MECTEAEREHCECEKLGCEGCYYYKQEPAIIELNVEEVTNE